MNTVAQLIIGSLAVLGAFVLGGWVTGHIWNRIAAGWFKDNKVPDWMSWLARTFGGVLFAFAAWVLFFSGGGGGLGGPGGIFSGSPGTSPSSSKEKEPAKSKDEKDDKDKKKPAVAGTGDTMQVEVLGDEPLRRMSGESFDRARRYRLHGVPELLTLEDLKRRIGAGLANDPPLVALEVVVYKDSPSGPPLKDLLAYARDIGPQRLRVTEVNADKSAP